MAVAIAADTVPTLTSICQNHIVKAYECSGRPSHMINDLCKFVPDVLLEPIFESLLTRGTINEMTLLAYLVPYRTQLTLNGAHHIRNSILKQIGYNCPNLRNLDLSGCGQISNSVVRSILQGCAFLERLDLNHCHRVTHAAFDFAQSPFHTLVGCLSLESISLQGCPQITGDIVSTLNTSCRRLNFLNISQCKKAKSPVLHRIFEHRQLLSLNLAFIDDICDDTFNSLSSAPATGRYESDTAAVARKSSPLQSLNLGKCRITDLTLTRLSFLSELLEIRLQWCSGISDAGVASIARHSPKLQHMDVQSCGAITDRALHAVADHCCDLRHLNLSWCQGFSTQGLRYLADKCCEEKESRSLSSLSLVWCQQVDDPAVLLLGQIPSMVLLELVGCAGVTAQSTDLLTKRGISYSQ